MAEAKVSVVITTRNEERHVRHLLDSLVRQPHLHEVIVVDSCSTDRTQEIVSSYEEILPGLTLIVQECSRGGGRNIAAAQATGDTLAFIDGDCMANARWLQEATRLTKPDTVVAGKTHMIGYWAFCKLHRVELPHRGHDTTWPSCNLFYPRKLFEELGGFDESLVTAEDIDLNFRAVETGATIQPVPEAIVYARARESIASFLRQAFWNGYGRKQLTQKHGRLWSQYPIGRLIRLNGASFWGLLRMAAGMTGYLAAKWRKA